MQIIAHRGYSAKYTQNTIEAFEQALLLNVDAIELDIHQVEDEFVVFHDFDIAKLTGTTGRIDQLSLKQINRLRVMGNDKIPLLREVLALVGDQTLINIEIKSLKSVADFTSYLVPLIEKYNNRIALSSFNHPLLQACKSALSQYSGVRYGALIAHLPIDYAKYASDMIVDIAAVDCESVDRAFVSDAHEKKLEVWSYTVNDFATLARLYVLGVDAVFTDNPKWAIEAVKGLSN
jgi:glycerophosphoryl diester phosphodiesterase